MPDRLGIGRFPRTEAQVYPSTDGVSAHTCAYTHSHTHTHTHTRGHTHTHTHTHTHAQRRQWLDEQALHLSHLVKKLNATHVRPITPTVNDVKVLFDRRLPAFGWTVEHVNMLVKPMVTEGKEALGSMGNDAPLACLSKQPRSVFDYFKQLFAQVRWLVRAYACVRVCMPSAL